MIMGAVGLVRLILPISWIVAAVATLSTALPVACCAVVLVTVQTGTINRGAVIVKALARKDLRIDRQLFPAKHLLHTVVRIVY